MGKVRMIPGHQVGRCEKPREGGSDSPLARDIVIVHSSDLHVDNDYTARIHGGDGTAGLACVLCKARSMSADLVLLAGDTFENNRLPADLLSRTAGLIAAAGLPGVPLPGHHEPAGSRDGSRTVAEA